MVKPLVEVSLTLDEYDIVQRWFALLYASGRRKPSKDDIHLSQKITFMQIAEIQNYIKAIEGGGEFD